MNLIYYYLAFKSGTTRGDGHLALIIYDNLNSVLNLPSNFELGSFHSTQQILGRIFLVRFKS